MRCRLFAFEALREFEGLRAQGVQVETSHECLVAESVSCRPLGVLELGFGSLGYMYGRALGVQVSGYSGGGGGN